MAETIDAKLMSYIATRDRRLAKLQPWTPTRLGDAFAQLLDKGAVTVGGRASCGGKVDATWLVYTSWCDVVMKARKLGFVIDATPIKHGNGWASKAGGFWQENEYRLISSPTA